MPHKRPEAPEGHQAKRSLYSCVQPSRKGSVLPASPQAPEHDVIVSSTVPRGFQHVTLFGYDDHFAAL